MELSNELTVFLGRYRVLLSLLVLLISVLMMMTYYSRKLRVFEIITVSTLSAVSVAARIALFFVPFFKPCSAIVIISGSIFGPYVGSFIGALTGLLSNIVLGQGTWTPFQMLAWGLLGFLAGFLKEHRLPALIFGFLSVVIFYGGIMNFYSMLVSGNVYSTRMFWLFEFHGLPLDIIHGLVTSLFIFFGWYPIRKKLIRIKTKYGVLSKAGMYSDILNL